jgi:hypothetical protein
MNYTIISKNLNFQIRGLHNVNAAQCLILLKILKISFKKGIVMLSRPLMINLKISQIIEII